MSGADATKPTGGAGAKVRRTEARVRAARENGRKFGGRPANTPEYRDMRRTVGNKALLAGKLAADFLSALMYGVVLGRDGEPIEDMEVSIDIRERAAGRLYAKGVPDTLILEGTETIVPKLVEVARVRKNGKMEPAPSVPGPEDVSA